MKVYFVGAGPGDPELLTLKGRRLLERCLCCIYAGSLVNPKILDCLPPSAERHDSSRLSLEEIQAIIARSQERGVDVVRLHTGDPSIFGAMGEQMRELDRMGIPYEVVPGVSSFTAAAAQLQTPLTAPETSQTIVLTRIAGKTPVPEEQDLRHLAPSKPTLCLFLSVDRVREIAAFLSQFYGQDCPAAVVFRASWPDQKTVRGHLRDLADLTEKAGIKKTAMILVGWALDRPDTRSKLYDAAFAHGFREAEPR